LHQQTENFFGRSSFLTRKLLRAGFWFRFGFTDTHRAPSKKLIKFHVCIPEETAAAGQMNNVNVSRGHRRMFWAL